MNQDFLIKIICFCSYVIYFKVISVCLRAEVLIHTGIVVQSHANERVNDEDPFSKKTHNVFGITDVLVEKKVLFVILGI